MSEYSGEALKRVRVLRHDFRPSPLLGEEIGKLLKSGGRPDFLFHSTKEAYVDSIPYSLNQYRAEEGEVMAAMERWRRLSFEIAQVSMRRIFFDTYTLPRQAPPEVAKIRLAFLPERMDQFNRLVGTLDTFPDIYPRREPPRHYLYVDFSPEAVKEPGECEGESTILDEAVAVLQQRVVTGRTGLYSVNLVEGIAGGEKYIPYSAVRERWRDSHQDRAS